MTNMNTHNRNLPLNFEDFNAMLLEEKLHQKARNGGELERRKERVRIQVTHLPQKTKRERRRSSASTITKHGTSRTSVRRSLQMRRTA